MSRRQQAGKEERERRVPLKEILAASSVLAFAVAGALAAMALIQPQGDTGVYFAPQGSMTDDEARKMLDAQAESSRIKVSIRPIQELSEGRLHVNFFVSPDNNGFAERLEMSQEGQTIYASGIVEPGNVVEWAAAPAAHEGQANATIYAVDDAGADFGNPVSVEVEVVEA